MDPSHLRQILWNLCENAFRYSVKAPDDKVELRIGRLAGSNRPYLEVLDRGPGIEATISDRIFEPFRQLEPSMTRKAGGTGLGLAVSRRFAGLLGGTLQVTSQPGAGATFTLNLPISRPN